MILIDLGMAMGMGMSHVYGVYGMWDMGYNGFGYNPWVFILELIHIN